MSALMVARLTPDQMFGVLLYREGGKPIDHIAMALGVPVHQLGKAVDDAARGEFGRVPANEGMGGSVGSRFLRSAKGVAAEVDESELFLPRWQRTVVRKLVARDGTLAVAEVGAVRGGYPDDVHTNEGLHVALRRLEIRWKIELREGRAYYEVDGPGVETLRAIIANRWRPVTK